MIARLVLIFTLGFLLLDQAANAQYELKAGNFNTTFVAQNAAGAAAPPSGPPNAAGRTPDLSTATAGNYAGMGQVAATAGPLSNTTVYADRYPSTADNSLVLLRVTMGGVFASGVPRYSMGDVIAPPLVQADGVTLAAANYWRGQPVLPGETISSLSYFISVTVLTSATGSPTVTVASVPAALVVNATLLGRTVTGISGTTITLNGNANQGIAAATDVKFGTPGVAAQLFPLGTVNVTSAATNSTRVIVASVPAALVPGATLLGQPVTKISGNDVTLAANANATISSSTACPITPATSFYYSPHAEKAYATQPGRVTVTWVTRLADVNGNYFTKAEDFAVSSNTSLPVRTIFWTEGAFDGPKVQVNDGRITTVNAAYYSVVPKAVADEVSIPGYNPPSPNLTTLSFDKFNGIGQIHAYNVEGRVFIEYLGNVRLAGNIYESIGTDVVDLIRVPPVVYHTVNLGTEILPHNGDPVLTPSPVLSTAQNAASYYGTSVRPDGTASYSAERETASPNNPDNGEPSSTDAYNKVVFYWLEEADFSIKWPKFQDRYWLRWSPNLGDYAHYTVDANGSTPATGVPFVGSSLPQIVYQDDLAQAEAQMDLATQRLFVTFNAGNLLKRNRSLLKFTNTDKVWYVNLYTQAEGRAETLAPSVLTTENGVTTVTVTSTANLEAGMIVSAAGVTGTIARIIDGTRYVLDASVLNPPTANLLTLTNPSFEADAVPVFPGYLETPNVITGWTFAGPVGNGYTGFGLNNSSGPFASGPIPHGSKVAFIQGPGSLSTSITGLTVGTSYNLSLSVNARGGYADAGLKLAVAGVPLITKTIVSGAYQTVTAIFTAAATSATLKVESLDLPGDDTLLIDNLLVGSAPPLIHTVEADGAAPIDETTAIVGSRLTPPANHEKAGYISSGTDYYPAGYLNPFTVGVEAANLGAIIPVNALPSNRMLKVRWFKKVAAPSAGFQDLYVPGKWGTYTVNYPANTTPQIVIAQGVGTDDLPAWEGVGSIYYQNNSSQPGYNPNEEHALMLGGRAYALREDLNVYPPVANYAAGQYTSDPFVLVAYTDPTDHRPAIHAYKVVRTDATYAFDYIATAGTLLVKPYPLPLMPLALLPTLDAAGHRVSKDLETIGVPDVPANGTVTNDTAYAKFTFKDRKGFTWVHRGPHNGGSPTLAMKLYYLSRPGFFIPGSGGTGVPPEGTILPFLRHAARSGQPLDVTKIAAKPDGTAGDADEPLTIVYRPTWPTDAPELRVGETLTLPKFGLPQVRGQASAQVVYQQSIARDAAATSTTSDAKRSVTLHDPTREKTIALDAAAVGLTRLPPVIATASYQGKTYFQTLPPHLQRRFYFDPVRGLKGTLVFTGTFHDEIAGEDYLDLNLLTAAETKLLKGLVPVGNGEKDKWDAAIEALKTQVETFVPDTAKIGAYKVDGTAGVTKDVYATGGTVASPRDPLAVITNPNTAVDSYAITATGQGTGFVTMVFGNGNAFTPEGDPVQIQVFKIADQLYVGDLKVITSSNPLDEQVTLRHSGDFAGKPEDYEFEWRWATGAASAPQTYATTMTKRLGDPAAAVPSHYWLVVSDPGSLKPSAAQYTAAGAGVPFTPARTVNVHPVKYVLDVQGQPTSSVIEATSYTVAEIAAGYPALFLKSTLGVDFGPEASPQGIPDRIVFSAQLGSLDGFVLYVNGRAALAYNAPTPQFILTNASTGLTTSGLSKQFNVAPSYFSAGPNTVEVAVYTGADPNAQSPLGFLLEAAEETDQVIAGTVWQDPQDVARANTNTAIVGGSPSNPFGGPQFVLNDRWFTMRYKPKASANNVLGTPYSRWMPPQFVEGWIKRVLAAINPFEQRVKDLYNNQVSTDVSVITQAGTRWEGDVALTLDNINDVGLIAIYETVLNRGRNMSIDANTNDPDTNNALILAAGYLNDLYTLLGNEAYADAANPTISLDDQTSITEVNTSRFSFESQVASSLDEELALLRGRDDLVSPGVNVAPAYNRLFWNYTHGINSGEAIYAVNYNIKEKVGSSTANGVIDEADAQRMFPQGHGDAYGHYLTALTGYYRLLTNTNFTWTPRAEAVTVLGQPVTVDFQDERKFAAAAGNVARTAQQVVALAYRQSYRDDPGAGWDHYRDTKPENTGTAVKSAQGLDEWTSRSTQGALFNWAVANALVPDVDTYHNGVQKIDRSTVPEIQELAAAAVTFQTTIDNANAHLNPLGLSPGAIAFDLSPTLLIPSGDTMGGMSHFEQIYERSLTSLVNASGAFNQAATMTRSLRDQTNQLDDYNTVIVQQEKAYVNQLIDIYGRPYSGEIGAGKLYAQGYAGPDLTHWYIVDRPNDLVGTSDTFSITIQEPVEDAWFTGNSTADILNGFVKNTHFTSKTVTVQPSQWVQYNDVWKPDGLGSRAETGDLQNALQDAQQSWLAIKEADVRFRKDNAELVRSIALFKDLVVTHASILSELNSKQSEILKIEGLVRDLEISAQVLNDLGDIVNDTGTAIATFFPTVLGIGGNDTTSTSRGGAVITGIVAAVAMKSAGLATQAAARYQQTNITSKEQQLEYNVQQLGFSQEEAQLAYELDNIYREVVTHATELMQLTLTHQRALQQVQNVLAKGDRILAEREVFRQRAAAIIQGYRTKDLGFRIFRNEALEQYRSLFDLASRYTYLAAKSYDYETGLLGTTQGQTVFARIVSARSLGDLTGGVPQSTTSTLGDAGLAGTMALLNADFSVAKGRLGINNPDQYGTVFSLRAELYRIRTDQAIIADDDAWRQTMEQHMVANVMTDADVATYCRNIKKPDGTPVPGIVIPFGTTIQHAKNFFGLDYLPGDHNYTPSSYATKIYNVGIALPGYVGMDAYATGTPTSGAPASSDPNALGATPYAYLIPCGNDYMLAPPLGDTNSLRSWTVHDQALPLPYNLGANDFNSTQFFNANGTLSEQPWIIRKHQAFRMVGDASFFYGSVPVEFTNSRLIGRSVWNGMWKIVIPAYTLHSNEQEGLNRFAASVKDIQLFLRTYSHGGN